MQLLIKKIITMKTIVVYALVLLFGLQLSWGQQKDSLQTKKTYTNWEQAVKEPEKVYRLNLSNQSLHLDSPLWSKFKNLEYLNLSNDHLKTLPKGITNLKKLKVLEISGNQGIRF